MYEITHSEYMRLFTRWVEYQFNRVDDEWHNSKLLSKVSEMMQDNDELQYWANRDNWSLYHAIRLTKRI